MATFEEYRDRWIQQVKSIDDKVNLLAADVSKNTQNIECNAEGIEELAKLFPVESEEVQE